MRCSREQQLRMSFVNSSPETTKKLHPSLSRMSMQRSPSVRSNKRGGSDVTTAAPPPTGLASLNRKSSAQLPMSQIEKATTKTTTATPNHTRLRSLTTALSNRYNTSVSTTTDNRKHIERQYNKASPAQILRGCTLYEKGTMTETETETITSLKDEIREVLNNERQRLDRTLERLYDRFKKELREDVCAVVIECLERRRHEPAGKFLTSSENSTEVLSSHRSKQIVTTTAVPSIAQSVCNEFKFVIDDLDLDDHRERSSDHKWQQQQQQDDNTQKAQKKQQGGMNDTPPRKGGSKTLRDDGRVCQGGPPRLYAPTPEPIFVRQHTQETIEPQRNKAFNCFAVTPCSLALTESLMLSDNGTIWNGNLSSNTAIAVPSLSTAAAASRTNQSVDLTILSLSKVEN